MVPETSPVSKFFMEFRSGKLRAGGAACCTTSRRRQLLSSLRWLLGLRDATSLNPVALPPTPNVIRDPDVATHPTQGSLLKLVLAFTSRAAQPALVVQSMWDATSDDATGNPVQESAAMAITRLPNHLNLPSHLPELASPGQSNTRHARKPRFPAQPNPLNFPPHLQRPVRHLQRRRHEWHPIVRNRTVAHAGETDNLILVQSAHPVELTQRRLHLGAMGAAMGEGARGKGRLACRRGAGWSGGLFSLRARGEGACSLGLRTTHLAAVRSVREAGAAV